MQSSFSPPPPPATTVEGGGATFSSLDPDIIRTHILTRLDGPTLAAASSASAQLHSLSTQDHHLWSHICHSTWPSTATQRVRHVISQFPGGPRSFFADSFPNPTPAPNHHRHHRSSPPPGLISTVDLHYQDSLIFSKVQEMETVTEWFRCSPFRIDLLDPKEAIPTKVQHHPGDEDACTAMMESMTLSWILIDPIGGRAMNMSSHRPVSVQRHWLTGEVQVRFASILRVGGGREVECGMVVGCGGSAEEGEEMQVIIREISMVVEDMEGLHLTGKETVDELQRALEGERERRREEEGRRRYEEYLEKKRERRERKLRREGRLDTLCVAVGFSLLAAFSFFLFCY